MTGFFVLNFFGAESQGFTAKSRFGRDDPENVIFSFLECVSHKKRPDSLSAEDPGPLWMRFLLSFRDQEVAETHGKIHQNSLFFYWRLCLDHSPVRFRTFHGKWFCFCKSASKRICLRGRWFCQLRRWLKMRRPQKKAVPAPIWICKFK